MIGVEAFYNNELVKGHLKEVVYDEYEKQYNFWVVIKENNNVATFFTKGNVRFIKPVMK